MWPDLVCRWFPGDPFAPTGQVRAYYEAKHAVVLRLRPRSILEVGVRAGYSAFAMLSAVPRAEYLGIDAQMQEYGNSTAYAAHAVTLLAEFDARFRHADSQALDALPATRSGQPFQFAHVDGDHTYAGTRHDVALAIGSGARWVLVDDYDYMDDVRRAVAREAGALRMERIRDPLRGSALIHVEQAGVAA